MSSSSTVSVDLQLRDTHRHDEILLPSGIAKCNDMRSLRKYANRDAGVLTQGIMNDHDARTHPSGVDLHREHRSHAAAGGRRDVFASGCAVGRYV
jgi:hypothetical protein